MDLMASLTKKQETRPGSPGRLSPLSSLVKGRVEGVEVFGIQLVGEDAEALAKALKMNDFPFPQEFDGIAHIRIIREAEDVVIGHPGFLLWCDAVRTTFLPYGRQKQLWALKIPVYLDGNIPCPWNPLAHQDVVDKLFYNVPG